jgi:lysophospholipase L1-like esterase
MKAPSAATVQNLRDTVKSLRNQPNEARLVIAKLKRERSGEVPNDGADNLKKGFAGPVGADGLEAKENVGGRARGDNNLVSSDGLVARNWKGKKWVGTEGNIKWGLGVTKVVEAEIETAGFAGAIRDLSGVGKVHVFGDSQARHFGGWFGREGLEGKETVLSGYSSKEMEPLVASSLAQVAQDDAVFILAGTNDVVRGESVDGVVAGVVGLVRAVRRLCPERTRVVVAPLPLLRRHDDAWVADWMRANDGIADGVRGLGNVACVGAEVESCFREEFLARDGLHLSGWAKGLLARKAIVHFLA